ncbi:MAG: hypothetical protein JWP21_2044 [Tardiphaga sp.]|jgi:hypothetical protein|nr:hypothetical protein [Tardiphaga sp.]MDB5548597.1 hypothetical protein [Tardiphaga sp.]
MSDLLIHDLDPEMQRTLEQRARDHDRNVSQEAKALLRTSLGLAAETVNKLPAPPPGIGLGTWMFDLVPPEYRVDLDCDIPDVQRDPPDFR